MRRLALSFAVGSLLAILVVAASEHWGIERGHAVTEPSLGIDANPYGNTATALGDLEPCYSARTGESFSVDLWVADVVGLAGWQAELHYDASLLRVVGVDMKFLQSANQGSRVLDLSDPLPDFDGEYLLAGTDLAIEASDSGSGVLARINLQAENPGASSLRLEKILLVDADAAPISDRNGDSYFDGPVTEATVAIDSDCPTETNSTPTASPIDGAPSDGDGPTPIPSASSALVTPTGSPGIQGAPSGQPLEVATVWVVNATPSAQQGEEVREDDLSATPGNATNKGETTIGDSEEPPRQQQVGANERNSGPSTSQVAGIGGGIAVVALFAATALWYVRRIKPR